MDFSKIKEVTVTFMDGNEKVYRGKGLERLRKEFSKQPARQVIEDDSSSEEAKPHHKKGSITLVEQAKGYQSAPHVNYTPAPAGMSPYELAKQMQRSSGLSDL